ncbi:hypothetical protein [Thalassotalea maritima]|uniref:hypothetical protein n=1 Tax=Thalassotalea maritima TaxID=3242416 RepID=UPI003528997F
MFARFIKPSPLVDDATRQWLFDTYIWAIDTFGKNFFQQQNQLILPTNEFYPGRVHSVAEMTQLMFKQTLAHCGMQHWPVVLKDINQFPLNSQAIPALAFDGELRGANKVRLTDYRQDSVKSIAVTFQPQQVNQPQDLIATLVQQLAAALVKQRPEQIPGGQQLMPQTIDVVAAMMGFGVLFANTAYQFKGGCGSCYNAAANRQAMLPETEAVYALAIFCVVKNIPYRHVKAHLKRHLRSQLKQAYNELHQDGINSPSSLLAYRQR